ncbi:MAG: MmcQ/YjbR family DNA-binding protein [Candidatus Saccharibacteria bacterium]|nr:MmcQ/YjbR family DNA-binding protein [Candidatus Saccharibacteria bacterium]
MQKRRQIETIIEYIKAEYGAEPEFLWPDRYPGYAVFRHSDNKKWFALVATISKKSLGLEDDKEIDVINLKFDKNQTYDFAETSDHIFPAYHMNKNNWITVMLDGVLPDELVFELIRKSYLLSGK